MRGSHRLRRWRRGCTLGALAGILLGAAPAAVADDAPAGRVEGVQATSGEVRFVFSASNLAASTRLDPARLEVTLDGRSAAATATVAGTNSHAGALPARAVMVLLDTSGSMTGDSLPAARRAALDFARTLPADVRVGLVTFADRPRLALAPTTDRSRLARALGTATARGSTALYDAVTTALDALDRAGLPAGAVRRLVVLSDGDDTSSRATLAGTVSRLRAAKVPADVVGFRLAAGDAGTLRQVAAAAGGRYLAAPDPASLAGAFSVAARTIDQRLDVTVTVPADLAGRTVRLDARADTGAVTLHAGTQVTVPAAVGLGTVDGEPTPAEAVGQLVPATRGWVRWLVAGLVFAGLFAAGLLALVFGAPGDPHRQRLAQLERYRIPAGGRPAGRPAPAQPGSSVAKTVLSWVDRMVTARGGRQAVELELDRAGVNLRVQEWIVLRVCGCAGLAAVLTLLTRSLLIGVLAGAALGWLGTRVYLGFRAGRRCAAFARQLPDVLQLVASSLRSGFSLPQALDAVVRDGTAPIAGELSRALAETRLGVELTDALDKVAGRMRSRDLAWTVMAVRIQREVGGNLAEILQTTVATMRERSQLRRQVRALTAEGRLSAYVLVGLPIALGGWLFLTRRVYMRPLYTEPFGIAMLAAAGVLVVAGSLWLSRLVKVEV